MTKPVTNRALESLLAEAQLPAAALARHVCLLGRQRELALGYDGASVYWWLRGRVPDPPTPELIAEVLARRIGRRISAAEIGFSGADSARELEYPPTPRAAREAAAGLWARLAGGGPDASVDWRAVTDAGWRWHFDGDDVDRANAGSRRVTAADVERLSEVCRSFVTLDRQYGGGHIHPQLLQLLHFDVGGLLRGAYDDATGRALFAVAAELTGQLAFAAYDAGRHGDAQRGFVQGLRLAKAAGDRQLGAHILANMATQAVGVGRPMEAVQLARAAVAAAPSDAHPVVRARIYTTEASAHAFAHDATSFRAAVRASERAVDRVDGAGGRPPAWAGYFTRAHWAGSTIRGLKDLGRPAEALEHEAAALDLGVSSVRTRALHAGLLALVHAEAGGIDRAVELAHVALDNADGVRSERIIRRLTSLTQHLHPHRGSAEVAALFDRLKDRSEPR